MEQAKEKHHDRLVELDQKRQKPQAQLTDTIARRRTLEGQLDEATHRLKFASGQDRAAIEREIRDLRSGIADLQREIDELQGKLKRIDDEARAHHDGIRVIELPQDERELRRHRDAFLNSLDAARIALANLNACDHRFKEKHGQEGVRRAGVIRDELQTRERRLRAEGWTEIDAVSATIGPFQVVAMLPPVKP